MSPEDKFGMVAFEEEGMPWTRVFGKARLIKLDNEEFADLSPHWLIEFEGEECYVPESSVIIL